MSEGNGVYTNFTSVYGSLSYNNSQQKLLKERGLLRNEFIALIIRYAKNKFKDTKSTVPLSEAIDIILNDFVFDAYTDIRSGRDWRFQNLYNFECNAVCFKFQKYFLQIFELHAGPSGAYISLDNVHKFCDSFGIELEKADFNLAFTQSLVSTTYASHDLEKRMTLIEFVVFICRLAYITLY